MKKLLPLFLIIFLFCGCSPTIPKTDVVATTKPVYDFTVFLCRNTPIQVELLVTENVSCLHDYTLQVRQMRVLESAQTIVTNGAGLEDFLSDALDSKQNVICASDGITLLCAHHDHNDAHSHDHHVENDPHIWLDIDCARQMAQNICNGLIAQFPADRETILQNLAALNGEFDRLDAYGKQQFAQLKCRDLVTFHDGFAYFAHYWDLHILKAIEEESGSEASAAELKELITLVESHQLPAIFVEENGSTSASGVIQAETGVDLFTLNMAMGAQDYFQSMYQNIDNIKEALG